MAKLNVQFADLDPAEEIEIRHELIRVGRRDRSHGRVARLNSPRPEDRKAAAQAN